jgi:hypothetical protein
LQRKARFAAFYAANAPTFWNRPARCRDHASLLKAQISRGLPCISPCSGVFALGLRRHCNRAPKPSY